jgi:hypothetical protein
MASQCVRGALRQTSLRSRATARNSCRKNIRLSKLSPDSTLYCKVAERRGILSSSFQFRIPLDRVKFEQPTESVMTLLEPNFRRKHTKYYPIPVEFSHGTTVRSIVLGPPGIHIQNRLAGKYKRRFLPKIFFC